MGLDGLAGTDKVKAETANNTYESKCILIRLCHRLAIAVSLENLRILSLGRFLQVRNSWKKFVLHDTLRQIAATVERGMQPQHGGPQLTGPSN